MVSRVASKLNLKKYTDLLYNSKVLEDVLPRAFTQRQQVTRLISPVNYEPHYSSYTAGISEPCWDMLDRGGKTWRAAMCLMAVEALGKDPRDALPLAGACELIHNGSLMVDDIEDASQLRRGKPCSYLLYGVDLTINAGTYLYFAGQAAIDSLAVPTDRKLKMHEAFMQEMLALHLGLCSDMKWSKMKGWLPSEDEYYQMLAFKTSIIVRFAMRQAGLFAGCDQQTLDALVNYGDKFGIAFQIKDDLLNLESEEYAQTRSYVGEDITEGKRTIIVLRATQQLPPAKSKRLLEILDQKTSNLDLVKEALALINSTDAMQYSKAKAESFLNDSWAIVDPLLPPSEAKNQLQALASYLVYRSGY